MMSSEDSAPKRTRASGEVLDYLLHEFENNHNPSPEQRKEISDKTNMTEKAVRIWFQNRRAKLRKFERMWKSSDSQEGPKGPSSYSSGRTYSGNSRELSSPDVPDRSTIPIELNEKYSFIDCSSLSVGSWQRVRSGYHDEKLLKENLVNLSPFALNAVMENVDLLVLLSKKDAEVNYFFSAISNNSKILFRIFYPVSSIVTCSLLDNNISKRDNELRVSLSFQPKFSVYFFNEITTVDNQWSVCDDFSEDQQVSSAFCSEGGSAIPHVLVGCRDSLHFLNNYVLENNTILHLPSQYNQDIQLSDPNSLDREQHSHGNFQFPAEVPSLDIWDQRESSNYHHSRVNSQVNALEDTSSKDGFNDKGEMTKENEHDSIYHDIFSKNSPEILGDDKALNLDSARAHSDPVETKDEQHDIFLDSAIDTNNSYFNTLPENLTHYNANLQDYNNSLEKLDALGTENTDNFDLNITNNLSTDSSENSRFPSTLSYLHQGDNYIDHTSAFP